MKKTLILLLILGSLSYTSMSYADRGSAIGLGFIAGALVGSQLAYPYYARPYVYAPPTVIYSQPVYVQPAPPQAFQYQPTSQGSWYYCPSSGAYYPYVAQCSVPWQMVPSTPQ